MRGTSTDSLRLDAVVDSEWYGGTYGRIAANIVNACCGKVFIWGLPAVSFDVSLRSFQVERKHMVSRNQLSRESNSLPWDLNACHCRLIKESLLVTDVYL
jgi:hypothetical protein